MGIKLTLYNAIKAAVNGIATAPIKTFDFYNSQIENESREIPRTYPIVDLEFLELPWENTSQEPPANSSQGGQSKQQKSGLAIIRLHVQFHVVDESETVFENIEPVLELVHFAVHLLTATGFQPLQRVNENQDADHGAVVNWQIDYSTMLSDKGQESDLTNIPAGTLAVEITKDLDIDNDIIRTGDGL